MSDKSERLLAEADALDLAWDERERREAPLRRIGDMINDFACRVAKLTGHRIVAVVVPAKLAATIGGPVTVATAYGPVRIEVES